MQTGSGTRLSLAVVLREWGRLGCVGFGGPPAHIALLRELCVVRNRWIEDDEFEHAIAATNLLPGPASTQLAVYCAWRLRGVPGAIVGGIAFIVPGLALIIALAALFLGDPPAWVRGVGAGAGAVVAAVAVRAAADLIRPSRGAPAAAPTWRWAVYLGAGSAGAVAAGPWLVVVLLACGALELVWRRGAAAGAAASFSPWLLAPLAALAAGAGLGALAWTAFKVGALSYGGGFVIIPLMEADAVGTHHWMTQAEFTSAVALGQATPGPVVQTVAVVGWAADGLTGALLAAVVAFAPSFWFIGIGAARFDRLRHADAPRAFLAGSGPAAIGAILGAAVPLGLALSESWQYALLLIAGVLLLAARRGVLQTILLGAAAGAVAALAGMPLPA